MADGIIGGIGTGKSFTEPRYGNVAGLFLKNTPGLNETSGQSMKDFANASFPPETIGLMKTALIDPECTILNVLCRKTPPAIGWRFATHARVHSASLKRLVGFLRQANLAQVLGRATQIPFS